MNQMEGDWHHGTKISALSHKTGSVILYLVLQLYENSWKILTQDRINNFVSGFTALWELMEDFDTRIPDSLFPVFPWKAFTHIKELLFNISVFLFLGSLFETCYTINQKQINYHHF